MSEIPENAFLVRENVKVMFLGDSERFIGILKKFFENFSFTSDMKEAYRIYREFRPDILVVDTEIKDIFILSFLEKIEDLKDKSKVVLILREKSDYKRLLKDMVVEINGIIFDTLQDKRILCFLNRFAKSVIDFKKSREKEILARKIVDSQEDLIVITEKNEIRFANKAFLEFFDVNDIEEFNELNRNLCDYFVRDKNYFSCKEGSQEKMVKEILKLPQERRVVSMISLKYFEPRAFMVKINEMDENQAVFIFTDITRISLKSKEFEQKASYDELTDIYNRAKFNEILEYEMNRAKRYGNSLSLVIADIDNFKRINDTYGHLFGDEVLKKTAKIFKKAIRATDTVARWGGEEFVVLLNNCNLENAKKVAEHLREKVEEGFKKSPPNVTCSFGVSELKEYDTKETFLSDADKALYKAKKNGKNRVEIAVGI